MVDSSLKIPRLGSYFLSELNFLKKETMGIYIGYNGLTLIMERFYIIII